jgi:hypothetical protein
MNWVSAWASIGDSAAHLFVRKEKQLHCIHYKVNTHVNTGMNILPPEVAMIGVFFTPLLHYDTLPHAVQSATYWDNINISYKSLIGHPFLTLRTANPKFHIWYNNV